MSRPEDLYKPNPVTQDAASFWERDALTKRITALKRQLKREKQRHQRAEKRAELAEERLEAMHEAFSDERDLRTAGVRAMAEEQQRLLRALAVERARVQQLQEVLRAQQEASPLLRALAVERARVQQHREASPPAPPQKRGPRRTIYLDEPEAKRSLDLEPRPRRTIYLDDPVDSSEEY